MAQEATGRARQEELVQSAGAESRREPVADPEIDEMVREDSFAAVSARLQTLDACGLERAAEIIHEMTASGGFSNQQVKSSGKKLVASLRDEVKRMDLGTLVRVANRLNTEF